MSGESAAVFDPCRVVLGGEDWFFAWYVGDADAHAQFGVDGSGRVVRARSVPQLRAQWRVAGLGQFRDERLHEPDYTTDLDAACTAVKRQPVPAAYPVILESWNVMDERCSSLGRPLRFTGRLTASAYDKLFRGLNLPSVTPPGEYYTPTFTRDEWRKVRQVILRTAVRLPQLLG